MRRTITMAALLLTASEVLIACGGSQKPPATQPVSLQSQRMSANAGPSAAPIGWLPNHALQAKIYPDNSHMSRSSFLSVMQATRAVHVPDATLRVDSVTLTRWSQTSVAKRGIIAPQIDPNRMVYEVATSFNHDYEVRGNHWSSGKRYFIVDAQTGLPILSQTLGVQTVNAGHMRWLKSIKDRTSPAFYTTK